MTIEQCEATWSVLRCAHNNEPSHDQHAAIITYHGNDYLVLWEFATDKPELIKLPNSIYFPYRQPDILDKFELKGGPNNPVIFHTPPPSQTINHYNHVHVKLGPHVECVKNRYGPKCDTLD